MNAIVDSVRPPGALSRAGSGVIPSVPRKRRNSAFVETKVAFRGESVGALHFFTQFRDVVFRWRGSVLPKIAIECTIAFALGSLAYVLTIVEFGSTDGSQSINVSATLRRLQVGIGAGEDALIVGDEGGRASGPSSVGHTLLGLLLGFLTVFRTQSGFSFYLEGQAHLAMLSKTLHTIAIEALGSLPSDGGSAEQAALVLSVLRRCKLFYYAVVEHLRSNVSFEAWLEAHSSMLSFATQQEVKELTDEFGVPTVDRGPHQSPTDIDASDASVAAELMAQHGGPAGGESDDAKERADRKRSIAANTVREEVRTKLHEERATRATRARVLSNAVQSGKRWSVGTSRGSAVSRFAMGTAAPMSQPVAPTSTGASAGGDSASGAGVGTLEGAQTLERAAERAASERSAQGTTNAGPACASTADRGPAPSPSPEATKTPSRRPRRLQQASNDPATQPAQREGTLRGVKHADFGSKDPTSSKPMLLALWIRRDVQRLAETGQLSQPQLASFTGYVDDALSAYLGMHKIDRLVLPLPYSQLLKIFSMFFVYSVPFVLAPTVGLLTPFVCLFLAAGYFGLDQLGAELECPFGKDDNHLPLLAFGSDLCANLDTLVRGVARQVGQRRRLQESAARTAGHTACKALGA